jgi:hypothetical protein
MISPPGRAEPATAWRARLLFLGACLAFAAVVALQGGQDACWDLRNYHFYTPFGFLEGRLDPESGDLAAAQLQSWLHPAWDVPFYMMVRAGLRSEVITALLALPAGLALFLLVAVARRLAPGKSGGLVAGAVLLLGATAATSRYYFGSTQSEWHLAALVLGAAWLTLGSEAATEGTAGLLLGAGFLGGVAAGFKLTASPAVLGLIALGFALPGPARRRLSRACWVSLGALAGTLVVYGPWGWYLYRRFGNPFFPFFNEVFHAPILQGVNPGDPRFHSSVLDGLLIPVRLLEVSRRFTDFPTREPRLALSLVALLVLATSRQLDPAARGRWRGLLAFTAASFAGWALAFGGYLRYASPFLQLSSLAVVLAPVALLPRRHAWVSLPVAILVALATVPQQPERVPHGRPAVVAVVPPLPANTMVLIASGDPVSYAVPSLPPSIPVVALSNNMFGPRRSCPLLRLAQGRARAHAGPLFLLTHAGPDRDHTEQEAVLDVVAVKPDWARCAPLQSGMEHDLALCPLRSTLGEATQKR